jgi:hypothetical protein
MQTTSDTLPAPTVWILIGSYDYSSSHIIAVLPTKAEAEALKEWGEHNKTCYDMYRYGYDDIWVEEWKVGERGDNVPHLPAATV